MKFYNPVKKHYISLSSENAEIVNDNVNNINFSWKWNIPSFFIKNGEVKLKSINAIGLPAVAPAVDTYIIRLKTPLTDNSYDTMYRDPILFISKDLNDSVLTEAPELRIHNKNINEISIKINDGITIANIDNGIDDVIVFVMLLEFTDYEPQETSYSYNVNDKQNYNPRII